jgi:hypothetical protein
MNAMEEVAAVAMQHIPALPQIMMMRLKTRKVKNQKLKMIWVMNQ